MPKVKRWTCYEKEGERQPRRRSKPGKEDLDGWKRVSQKSLKVGMRVRYVRQGKIRWGGVITYVASEYVGMANTLNASKDWQKSWTVPITGTYFYVREK